MTKRSHSKAPSAQGGTTLPVANSNGSFGSATPGQANNPSKSESELLEFIENIAVCLHSVAEDGTILWANRAELALFGYRPDEYVGHNIAEFHVDPPVIADILARLKRNEALVGCESRVRCKDGAVRDVAITSSVYRDEGRFVHTRCVTQDITERKNTSELRERLSAIVQSSDDAIISKDLNGVIRSWNQGAERIFGYTAAEIVGKHISTLAAPDVVDEIPDILSRLARGERIDHYRTKRKTKDGRILIVSLSVSPIRDASGTVIGASKVGRDVTAMHLHEQALHDANSSLRRANADLEQFAYSASHDLQEPLRMIAAYTELLQRDFQGKMGPAANEYIGYAVEGAVRMEMLLKDLRAYAHASTSERIPPEDVDASAVLDKVLANLDSALQESGATVTRTPLPRVSLYEFHLEQVFQNLLANAVRYHGSAPPEIHVGAERRGNEWVFSVRDNGIGIDPQYKEQIFGIFKRLHSTTEYPGTGMGLAICQRIIERIGGRIWTDSEPGRGSTFSFTVPFRQD